MPLTWCFSQAYRLLQNTSQSKLYFWRLQSTFSAEPCCGEALPPPATQRHPLRCNFSAQGTPSYQLSRNHGPAIPSWGSQLCSVLGSPISVKAAHVEKSTDGGRGGGGEWLLICDLLPHHREAVWVAVMNSPETQASVSLRLSAVTPPHPSFYIWLQFITFLFILLFFFFCAYLLWERQAVFPHTGGSQHTAPIKTVHLVFLKETLQSLTWAMPQDKKGFCARNVSNLCNQSNQVNLKWAALTPKRERKNS